MKRYNQFQALSHEVAQEYERMCAYNPDIMNGVVEKAELPMLPKKRWFETQRWLNRYAAASSIGLPPRSLTPSS